MKRKLVLAVTFIILIASFSTACGKTKDPVVQEAEMGKKLIDEARDVTGQQKDAEEEANNMATPPAE